MKRVLMTQSGFVAVVDVRPAVTAAKMCDTTSFSPAPATKQKQSVSVPSKSLVAKMCWTEEEDQTHIEWHRMVVLQVGPRRERRVGSQKDCSLDGAGLIVSKACRVVRNTTTEMTAKEEEAHLDVMLRTEASLGRRP